MNSTQQRAVAAAFMHAIKTTPELFMERTALRSDDYAAIGGLVQTSLGLEQTPTETESSLSRILTSAFKNARRCIASADALFCRAVGPMAYRRGFGCLPRKLAAPFLFSL